MADNAPGQMFNDLNGDNRLSRNLNFDETIAARDGLYRDDAFAALFAPLLVKNYRPGNLEVFVVMGECFSGGFVRELGFATHVATSAGETELACDADTEGPYQEFLYHFLSALAGQDPYGVAVNLGGGVSWRMAFDYAAGMENQPETPQFR